MHEFRPQKRSRLSLLIRLLMITGLGLITFASRPELLAQEPGTERFVPASELNAVFERSPSGVVIPRAQFDEILQKAQQAHQRQSELPADVVIRSATYQIRQEDQHAVVDVQLDIQQFADRWVTLPVPTGNLRLEDARIDHEAAAVERTAERPGFVVLAHRNPGRFVLSLQLSTSLGVAGADRLAAIRLPDRVAGNMTVACPADRFLQVNGQQLPRPDPADQPTEYRFPIGSADSVRLKWTTRRESSEMQTLIFCHSDVHVQLNSDTLRWDSTTRVSVYGNRINQLVARVPVRLEVTSVDSTGLESWKLEDDPDDSAFTRVLLNYRQPFQDDRIIHLTAVAPVQEKKSINVPTLEFLDVTAHAGRILATRADGLRLSSEANRGIQPQPNPGEASQNPSFMGGEVFDFWLQDYDLSLAVRPRDRELFAQINSALRVSDATALLSVTATVESLNRPSFNFTVQLPEDWQVVDVSGQNGQDLLWRSVGPGQLLVTPTRPVAAGELLTIVTLLSRPITGLDSERPLPLPVVTIADATTVAGTYSITTQSDLVVTPIETSGLAAVADSDGVLLFETQATTWSGTLSIARRAARLAARSVIRSWQTDRQTTVALNTTVDVTSGTRRSLTLLLSEDLGPDVPFEVRSIGQVPGLVDQKVPATLRITEQQTSKPVDGLRAFELTFDRRFAGAVTLAARIDRPRGESKSLPAPVLNVRGATRQHGLIVFEAYPTQQLTAAADTMHLQPADAAVVEAPPLSTDRRVALVYRFVRPDYSLTVSETEFATAGVPSAICSLLQNQSVLSDTGTIQRSSTIHFQASGVQTLQFSLPAADSAFLWSTVLDGKPVEVRREQDHYLVAIPTAGAAQEHELKLLFESTYSADRSLGTVSQESIDLFVTGDDGQPIPVAVLMQSWEVFYPSSTQLIDHSGGFVPVEPTASPGWFISVRDHLTVPSYARVIESLVPLGIVALMLFVVTALIVRRRWKSLAGLLVVGLVLVLGVGSLLLGGRVGPAILPSIDQTVADSEVAFEPVGSMYAEDESVIAGREFGGGFGGEYQPEDAAAKDEADAMGDPFAAPAENNISGPLPNAAPSVPLANGAAVQQKSSEVLRERNRADSDQPQSAVPGSGSTALSRRSGAARLSVLTDFRIPDSYRSTQFRSIGASDQADELSVVVRPKVAIQAIRWIAAGLVFLACVWIQSKPVFNRLLFAVLVAMIAAAALPLLPAMFQPGVDGVVLGLLVGVAYWVFCGLLRLLTNCLRYFSRFGKTSPATRHSVTTAVGVIACVLTFAAPSLAQEADTRLDVVLPYSADEPALAADKVFLPKEQFLKLYRLAYPDQFPSTNAPQTGAAVVAAFYESQERRQIEDTQWSQQFKVRFVIQAYADGASVKLPLGPVAIRSVRMNGEDFALLTKANLPADIKTINKQQPSPAPNAQAAASAQQRESRPTAAQSPAATYQIRTEAAGLHLLDIVFEVPATIEKSVGSFKLPVRPVAVGSLNFELPAEDLTAKINGRSNLFRRQGQRLTVPVSELSHLSLEWLPESESGATESIFHAESQTALVLNNTGRTLHSQISIVRRQGTLSEVEIQIPQQLAVQSVSGAEVTGWNVQEGEPRRLKVLFRDTIETSTRIQLTLFERVVFSTEDQTFSVPVPAIPAATRDSGYVTVVAEPELEVRVQSLSGVSQINVADALLPSAIGKNAQRTLAWRYTRQPAEISIRAFRTRDQTRVTALHGVQLETQRQLWTTRITAEVQGAPRRRLEILVPDDFLVLDVAAHDLQDWYLADQDGGQRLLTLQFEVARRGMIAAVVQGQRGLQAEPHEVQLMVPLVRDATKLTSQVGVWLSDASAFESFTATDWQRISNRQALQPELKQLKPEEPAVAFSATDAAPAAIVLKLRQKPVTLSPESVLITSVTDRSLDLTLALNWKTDNAVTQLSFSLPSELRNAFDFQIPGLRQLNVVEGENGRDIYRVQLQQPVLERFFLLGTATLPIPTDRRIVPQKPEFVVPDEGQIKLSPQSHFWVLVNQSAGLLTPADTTERSDDLLPEDIRLPQAYLQQSVAIRRLAADRPLPEWELTFPETQQVAPAVVTLAAHRTIFASDGSWRSRHQLRVRNESRQYLPVAIPHTAQFLFCTVNDRPTRVVQFDGADRVTHLIPVPQSGIASAALKVSFALAGRIDRIRPDINGSELQVPGPSFPDYREDPKYGITVVRNTWQVYLPDHWIATVEEDSQLTNVVLAEDEELEDASLMSVIDNARSSVSILKSAKSKLSNESLYQTLQTQQSLLRDQKGNSGESESLRRLALDELNVQIQQLGEDRNSVWLQQGQTLQGNSFLLQMDSEVNRFNCDNTAQLFLQNGPMGLTQPSAEAAARAFCFDLPGQNKSKTRAADRQGQNQSDAKKPMKGRAGEGDGRQGERRSKLIEQRGQNLEQQLGFSRQQLSQAQSKMQPNQPRFEAVPQAATAQPPSVPDSLPGLFDDDADVSLAVAGKNTAAPAGTLSLEFDLPEQGVRYDFVRGDGNPVLTLNVRSRESVRTAAGLLWAAGCFVVLFLLLKAGSVAQLLLRSAVLLAVAGVALLLLWSGPLRFMGAAICLVSLIAISLLKIAASFRRRKVHAT